MTESDGNEVNMRKAKKQGKETHGNKHKNKNVG